MDNRDQPSTPYFIRCIHSPWLPETGAHADDLRRLQAHWSEAAIPEDFIQLLRWSNGGRCVFPHVYVDLWSVASIIQLNRSYQIRLYLGDSLMGIGTDGGSTLIALVLCPLSHGQIVSFDLGDLDISQGKPIAESIVELFRKFDSGLLTSDNLYP
ncbi:SMI1/KNR4 family protein [Stenotrophomonas maltophilia]|uniref:SMI1/KNR4 family protein n=1 Tax=Stenotrophomonas maltophilia TaxID=40324 RepID=UPI0018D325EF|nr:SMI1/KNR4 family protein [Stenotrophomonas maltophilia]HDS1300604.1 SMI1/KNR4 family protein [Stenotrophomonas maltophilia]HDS1521987.1 SMI1/KNR4 family protein [Stenotrophomonas maltophilia]HDS1657025.1 SMI1/KNR4 family protein [Stenotrophomonas maltophilia]HDS1671043.1 SMI1/KNR4 family protein [Stenotrophomonas maltophilia]